MSSAERIHAIKRWVERAETAEEPVDRFLAVWVALSIAAKRVSVSKSAARRVRDYFRFHKYHVLALLGEREFTERRLMGRPEPPALADSPTKLDLLERAIWETTNEPNTPAGRLNRIVKYVVETENDLLRGDEALRGGFRIHLLTPFLLALLRRCELQPE